MDTCIDNLLVILCIVMVCYNNGTNNIHNQNETISFQL